MRRISGLFIILAVVLMSACTRAPQAAETTGTAAPSISETTNEAESDVAEDVEMKIKIGSTPVDVVWEENESVEALKALAAEAPLKIQMTMYGGFEQVGEIGNDIPSDNEQITTNYGDIVLYSGNQLVVFYGSNSWSYTRLGKITDKSQSELEELLSNGDVEITIYQ